MNIDQFVNLIYFIVGLGIGLFQLYWGQRQFELQQKEKMDELRTSLTDIKERIAVIQEVSSQRAFDVQDKLIKLATREEAVTEVNETTASKVRELVVTELQKAGVSDAIERTKTLESKLTQALTASTSAVVDIVNDNPVELTPRQAQVLELVLKGYTTEQVAKELNVALSTARNLLSGIYLKAGVTNRAELLNTKFASPNNNKPDN